MHLSPILPNHITPATTKPIVAITVPTPIIALLIPCKMALRSVEPPAAGTAAIIMNGKNKAINEINNIFLFISNLINTLSKNINKF